MLTTRALKEALDVFIYPVAVFGPLALLPQVFTLYTSQSAGTLSLPTWLMLGLLNLAWLLYGAVHREWPIIVTNLALAFLNFAVVFGILLYR
jgi:uncharacterized protein with PQ loop repeat